MGVVLVVQPNNISVPDNEFAPQINNESLGWLVGIACGFGGVVGGIVSRTDMPGCPAYVEVSNNLLAHLRSF